MAVATGSLSDLGYARETTYGVEESGTYTTFRRKNAAGLNLTKDSYDSEEIRVDRQLSDSRHGVRRAAGDVETELSPGSYDIFLAALLGADTATNGGYTNLSATVTPLASATWDRDTGQILFPATVTNDEAFLPGTRVRATGTTGAGELEGRYFTVVGWHTTTNPQDTLITDAFSLVGNTGTLALGACTLTAQGKRTSVASNPTSFTMERAYTDIGQFQVFKGMRVNSAAVSLPPTGLASVTWNFLGQNASALAQSSSHDPYTNTALGSVLAAVGGTLMIQVGSTLSNALLGTVTDLTFTIDNQMGGSEVVGKNYIPDVLFGNTQMITGKLTVLFENAALYNVFENETEASLVFTMVGPGAESNKYITFALPRMKFNSGNIGDAVATGLPVEVEFRALRPTATTSTSLGYAAHSVTSQIYINTSV